MLAKESPTQNTNIYSENSDDDCENLIHPDLLIGHPVDDAVITWVHVPQVVSNDDDGEDQHDHHPQHYVKDHCVLKVVLVGQVVRAARVTLEMNTNIKLIQGCAT